MARLIPSEGLRRLVTGFLFGTTGACIALSPVGKVSGAHINPAVTLAFRLMGKLDLPTTLGYVGAQLIGAVVGSLPPLLWGAMGRRALRDHGVGGIADLGHQHEPRTQPWSFGHKATTTAYFAGWPDPARPEERPPFLGCLTAAGG